MSSLIPLIIQVIAGAIGGQAVGSAAKNFSLGPVGNIITGAIGGGVGGQILAQVIPALAAGDLDIGSIVGQLVGGGAAGAVLTAIVGAVKNAMAKR